MITAVLVLLKNLANVTQSMKLHFICAITVGKNESCACTPSFTMTDIYEGEQGKHSL